MSDQMERKVKHGGISDGYRDIYPDRERDSFFEHFACYVGRRSALCLRRLDGWKPMLGEGVIGMLDAEPFAEMIRNCGWIYLYQRQIKSHMRRRERDERMPELQRAFDNRRKRQAAGLFA